MNLNLSFNKFLGKNYSTYKCLFPIEQKIFKHFYNKLECSPITYYNKNLEEICENLKIQKITAESLELGAIISLRLNFPFEYVIKECKISKSFLKRLERLYEINTI